MGQVITNGFANKSLEQRLIPNNVSEKNCLRLQCRGSAGLRYTGILAIFGASIAEVKHSIGTGSAQSANQ